MEGTALSGWMLHRGYVLGLDYGYGMLLSYKKEWIITPHKADLELILKKLAAKENRNDLGIMDSFYLMSTDATKCFNLNTRSTDPREDRCFSGSELHRLYEEDPESFHWDYPFRLVASEDKS